MVPAQCENCDGSPSQTINNRHATPNLAVILGVLGGMAAAAVLVFICVPLIRRRTRAPSSKRSAAVQVSPRPTDVEKGYGHGYGLAHGLGSMGGVTRRKSSLMSYISRWRRFGNLGSRRTTQGSSYDPLSERDTHDDRHPHPHHPKQPSQDEKGAALLPLLPELSTFTWSDLRSKNTSAGSSLDSIDDEGFYRADTYSLPTNAATLSHNTSHGTQGSQLKPTTGPVGTSSPAGAAPPPSSVPVSPQTHALRDPHTKRSLTPPGLSSKASSTPDLQPDCVRVHALFAGGDRPRVLLPPSASAPTAARPGIAMDPRKTSHAHHQPYSQTKSGSLSRPGSLQLPSPPDSPPLPAGPPASLSRSTSRAHAHAPPPVRTLSIGPAHARPPLPATRSAPLAGTLPFRPPTSSTPAGTPAWWSTASAQHPSTLSPPQSPPRSAASHRSSSRPPSPLTHAFRAPLQRSPSQATRADERHPAAAASPLPMEARPPGRSRDRSATVGGAERPMSTSAAGERPARTPQGARPLPGHVEGLDAGRRDAERKAHLRASMSLPQTPKVVDESRLRREKGQSVALGYFPGTHAGTGHASSSHAQAQGPAAALAALSAAPPSAFLSPSSPPSSSSSSRRHSVSAQQPALVRARDSPALRPLPASTLLHPASPPTSPPLRAFAQGGGRDRAASIRRADLYGGSRSRSGSVASLATLGERPEHEEGASAARERERRERRERRESVGSRRSVLPPVERLAPLEFGEFEEEGR